MIKICAKVIYLTHLSRKVSDDPKALRTFNIVKTA